MSTTGLNLRTAVFSLYINDLTENLKCNVKLFTDDTSLFTVVQNPNTAANDMNHDLEVIKQWAHSWRMSFDPDPQKQAVEMIFSRKRNRIDHPVILFNGTPVKNVDEHKHLGLLLLLLSYASALRTGSSNSRIYMPRKRVKTLDQGSLGVLVL